MKPPRWTTVSQSAFAWERDALDFARVHLPDYEPWRAWSNFEFIDDEGRVNEVDLLILTPAGLVLVEIKSRPGTVKGDVLEGVEHQGIQRVLDYREAEQGPALIFEHNPDWLRLDRYLAQKHPSLSLSQRLALVRQLGDAMAFAHGKRLYHRGLAPQNVLVRNPDSDSPASGSRTRHHAFTHARRGGPSHIGLQANAGATDRVHTR